MAKHYKNYGGKDMTAIAHSLGLLGNIGYKKIANALSMKLYGVKPRSYKVFLYEYFKNNPQAKIKKKKTKKPRTIKPKNDFSNVTDKSFLSSYKWRKLRMVALKKHGPRCQCCGATPEIGAVMNVDHIKPRKKYPELALDIENLQILCGACNHGKSNWDETDWRS
jgi:5-methylcytosine-specific restriction endonuclease McrA